MRRKPVRMFMPVSHGTFDPVVSYAVADVRIQVGLWFDEKDWRVGWGIAKKHGYRVVAVIIRPERPLPDKGDGA